LVAITLLTSVTFLTSLDSRRRTPRNSSSGLIR
jgi:hypothetical protein